MADHNGSADVHPAAGRTGAGGATEDCNGQSSSTKLPILDISAAQGAAGMAAAVALFATDGAAEPPSPGSPTDRRQSKHKSTDTQKLGHRRVKEGEVTYKKIETSTIMGAIQLGIAYAVGAEASKPKRDVLLNDFYTVETIDFPRQGGQFTPAHHYYDFRLKIYATVGFKYFRALFGIRPDDFLVSMCHSPLRELTNAGASGSIFYLSHDDEFIMKTVQHKEGDLLQKLLPGYFMNLNQNPRTLLPKFFGLYCYNCNSKNIRLVVMNNLLPSSIKMHQRYDLKGSTYKRKANKHERAKKSPTYKDLDFLEQHPEGLMLEAPTYTALMQTIQNDCRVLESFMIMDYSLLIGVYNLDLAAKEKAENIENVEAEAPGSEGSGGLTRTRSINRQRLVAHSTAMESIQAESEPIDEQNDVPPGGIPARNSKGERLLLFLGIIDILQSYRFGKRLEHTLKAMVHDGNTISVHRPDFYSKRFFDFMGKRVFQKIASPLRHSPSKRKSQSLRTRVLDGERRDTGESTAVAVDNRQPRISVRTYPASIGLSTQVAARSSSERHVTQVTIRHDSDGSTEIGDRLDAVSISDIRLESGGGRRSRSALSVDSGSAGGVSAPAVGDPTRHLRHVTWTPPMSVEGSTPTWTEGTPSFTESSSSGDMGCPTTPARVVTSELGSRDRSATGNGHRGTAAASCNAVPSPRTYRETEMVDGVDTDLSQEQSTCVRVLHSSDAPP